jgi:hypothetical protein
VRVRTLGISLTVKMGRFYIRFFEQGVEVEWYQLDPDLVDYLVENVVETCGPTYHSRGYFDAYDDGDDLCLTYSLYDKPAPVPKELVTRTLEVGWGKSRKELRLVGDRIPIDSDYKFQITYW